MIQLLFMVIAVEASMVCALLFKTPLRKLLIMALDRLKRGRGPLMVKTVCATVLVVLLSTLYTMLKIHNREIDDSAAASSISPTDQVLMANHLLEATLMGAVLFLALMIDRLHHYIRELRVRRKTMEAVKKQVRGAEDGKLEEMKAMEEEAAKLRAELKHLKSELQSKTKEVDVSEANIVALRKQSEGFLLEYDRLLEENQSLRNQLQLLDRRLSHSSSKKNM